MIYKIWCRLLTALHVLFVRRVMVIEQRQDLESLLVRLDLWSTIDDKRMQITIMRELADSIEAELQEEKLHILPAE